MFRTQIKASIIKESQERSPEFVLWQAVIAQAITDAKYNGLRKPYLECKRLAIAWFSSYSKDFKEVCQYANIDPDKILKDRRTPAQIKYEKKGFKLKF